MAEITGDAWWHTSSVRRFISQHVSHSTHWFIRRLHGFCFMTFFSQRNFGDFRLSLPRQTLTTHSAFFAEICAEPAALGWDENKYNKMEEEKPLYLFFSHTNGGGGSGIEIWAASNISCHLTATEYLLRKCRMASITILVELARATPTVCGEFIHGLLLMHPPSDV